MTSPAIPLLLRAFHPYLDRGMSQIVTSPDVGRQWMTPTLVWSDEYGRLDGEVLAGITNIRATCDFRKV